MSIPLGITFSHRQLRHLGIDVDFALQSATDLHFSHIRLGTYWSEIEKHPGEYNFALLLRELEHCERSNQPVVLTLGLKAPRWPEFYWPDFFSDEQKNAEDEDAQKKILEYIKNTVFATQKFSCITHWQIENEPLDPSGAENKTIPLPLLQKEMRLVKSLDARPLIVTAWGNSLSSRDTLQKLDGLSDIIGVDLYFSQHIAAMLNQSLYSGPLFSDSQLKDMFACATQPVWITELQAEPWEHSDEAYRSEHTPSFSPEILQKNVARALRLQPAEILLWGFEYWLYRSQHGDNRYLEIVQKILR